MNVALRIPASLDEFLAWEERQELRYEFDGVRAIAMVGGTVAHSRIASNIERALEGRLRPGCVILRGDLKLRLARSIRYPDVMVVCTKLRDGLTCVTNPTVVFEVLSHGTSHTDRLVKSQEYREAASIARYVIVEQTGIGATVFDRPDWRGLPVTGADTVLALPEIGVTLRLGECYAGLDIGADAT